MYYMSFLGGQPMDKLDSIYQFNLELLDRAGIEFQLWRHEPILDFTTDERVAKELGWTGTHTKSLFIKLKGDGYALYLTDKDTRLDGKLIKRILGKKPAICSNEEMIGKIGCVPSAVCPFGIPYEIPLVVDQRLHQSSQLLYTPGYPDATVGIPGAALKEILRKLPNQLFEV